MGAQGFVAKEALGEAGGDVADHDRVGKSRPLDPGGGVAQAARNVRAQDEQALLDAADDDDTAVEERVVAPRTIE